MAEACDDLVSPSEVLTNRLGLGRRFNDNQLLLVGPANFAPGGFFFVVLSCLVAKLIGSCHLIIYSIYY
ncbi:hypothetical protein AAEZ42_11120 [Limosilactobacillus fermentum]